MLIEIYTDGACDKNPGGNGGWAVLFVVDGKEWCGFSNGAHDTTNQRMELIAAAEALEFYKKKIDEGKFDTFRDVSLYSDSAYLINCVNQHWYVAWQRNGWRNSKKEPVANQDLWERLIPFFDTNEVQFKKVKGHNGNHWNELVDEMAVKERILTKRIVESQKVSNKESNQRN